MAGKQREHYRSRRRWSFSGTQLGSREKLPWRTCWHGHGGDEYGNCSVYFSSYLIGGLTFFWDPHFQRDVLLPDGHGTAAEWQKWYDVKFSQVPAEEAEPAASRQRGVVFMEPLDEWVILSWREEYQDADGPFTAGEAEKVAARRNRTRREMRG